jgi:hypothetical protein
MTRTHFYIVLRVVQMVCSIVLGRLAFGIGEDSQSLRTRQFFAFAVFAAFWLGVLSVRRNEP